MRDPSSSDLLSTILEINKIVFTGKFESVGTKCSKVFMEVDEKCWPQMFPLNPLFPPILKDDLLSHQHSSSHTQVVKWLYV
ncbi:unnamed protein product, partial [Thlaspi arvense]